MKKLYTISAFVLLSMSIMAQIPQSFKYQAVLRDGSGNIKTNTTTSIEISILQGSANGITVYAETHGVTTNAYGIVNLDLGLGTVINGIFANIDWSTGPYFVKVSVDGTDMGTSQLLSVPYALYAKTSGTPGVKGDNGDTGEQGLQGEKGEAGDAGAKGDKGDTGEQGIKGDKGDAGAIGAIGEKGAIGEQGLQGLKGDKGDIGEQGIKGDPGIKGDKGDAGNIGAKGDKGDTGSPGTNGVNGLTTSVNGVIQVDGAITLTKSNIGLDNVENTSDANKPVSAAAQTALNLKANTATTLAGYGITDAVNTTGDQTIAGVKSFNKIVVGADASNPSAVLDINSNSKGVLVPKLTDSERDAIVQPAEGLLIFNVTSKNFNVYKNGNWFEWQASNCVPQPTTAEAGTDQSVPLTSTSLLANTPVIGTGAWSVISGNGGTIAEENNPTSSFTGTVNSTYTLRWTITNSCGTSTDDVVITYQNFCSNGIKDYEETDIDCGGTACSKCSAGKICNVSSDCASNECTNSICTCPNGEFLDQASGLCVVECPSNSILYNNQCIYECPVGLLTYNGHCITECPTNYVEENGTCVVNSNK